MNHDTKQRLKDFYWLFRAYTINYKEFKRGKELTSRMLDLSKKIQFSFFYRDNISYFYNMLDSFRKHIYEIEPNVNIYFRGRYEDHIKFFDDHLLKYFKRLEEKNKNFPLNNILKYSITEDNMNDFLKNDYIYGISYGGIFIQDLEARKAYFRNYNNYKELGLRKEDIYDFKRSLYDSIIINYKLFADELNNTETFANPIKGDRCRSVIFTQALVTIAHEFYHSKELFRKEFDFKNNLYDKFFRKFSFEKNSNKLTGLSLEIFNLIQNGSDEEYNAENYALKLVNDYIDDYDNRVHQKNEKRV